MEREMANAVEVDSPTPALIVQMDRMENEIERVYGASVTIGGVLDRIRGLVPPVGGGDAKPSQVAAVPGCYRERFDLAITRLEGLATRLTEDAEALSGQI